MGSDGGFGQQHGHAGKTFSISPWLPAGKRRKFREKSAPADAAQPQCVSARTDPAWRPSDVTFVPDEPPSRGPLSGLTATLARIRSSHLLVLAIDMPSMNEVHLRYLCDRVEPGRGVLPMIGTRAEPLAAIYPVEARIDFINACSGVDFSLQTLANQLVEMGRLRVIQVCEKEQPFYRNLNEPDDLDG